MKQRISHPTLYDWVRATLATLLPGKLTAGALVALGLAVVAILVASAYLATQHTVVLEINGTPVPHRTHQRSAEGVLREIGLVLHPADLLIAPPEQERRHGAPLQVTLARHALLVHDGSVAQVRTHAPDVSGVLQAAGVVVFPNDRLYLSSKPCAPDALLPPPRLAAKPTVGALTQELRRPLRLTLRRAVPLKVQDGNIPLSFHTTASTVGEALFEQGIVLYQGDRVSPDLAAEITPGLSVFIERSKPMTLDVGGSGKMLRTRLRTVRELIAAEKIVLDPKDYVLPDPRSAIARDLHIAVVRVADEYLVEETRIPFETRWEPEPSMEIDQRRVKRWGTEGAKRRRVRIHYENGRELYRTEEEEWIAREPLAKIFNYGTKIVLRAVETPSGPLTYWRKLRMLATSYNAATAGTLRSRPWYGKTRLGLQAGKGIVAVDPSVISLGQSVYVPGYGRGLAADTGNAIIGRRVDLCYDDDNLELWYRWVDVYLLVPVPSAAEIDWIVSDYPQERG